MPVAYYPILEYAVTYFVSPTNITNLQTIQNTALQLNAHLTLIFNINLTTSTNTPGTSKQTQKHHTYTNTKYKMHTYYNCHYIPDQR